MITKTSMADGKKLLTLPESNKKKIYGIVVDKNEYGFFCSTFTKHVSKKETILD